MGHLEINGFKATRGHMMEDGMPKQVFDKFDNVFSGHFHTRSSDGKIHYLGNPYEMFWNDVNDPRGFTLFDTDTLEEFQLTILINCFITYIMKILIISCSIPLNIKIKL